MNNARSNPSTDEGHHHPCDPQTWPPMRGDYVVGDIRSRVAVMTLAGHLRVEGSAICGPCKTENLGIEKVVANVISNSNIRFLLVCGTESKGHLPGDAILALHRNGIDENGRIVGSNGAIPFIENLPHGAISRFQRQIEIIDRIGLIDVVEINQLVGDYRYRSEVYPEPPLEVVKKRTRTATLAASQGDVFFGSGIFLDVSAWAVAEK
ncbi:MAG: tetrahydromethanopterin S-methyltransferase subunit A [Methanotrichaceae archaeon]